MPATEQPHIGRKIERIRTIKGIKQDTLAAMLGVSQGAVSKMEQSAEIDEEKLSKVADALGVPADAIKNFNEDAAVNIVANTVNNHDQSALVFYNPSFNPLDKIVELYERLLESERKRAEQLEALLKSGK